MSTVAKYVFDKSETNLDLFDLSGVVWGFESSTGQWKDQGALNSIKLILILLLRILET